MGHGKEELSEVMVRAVISLYDDAKTRARVGSAYSEEVKFGVRQGSVLSPLLLAIQYALTHLWLTVRDPACLQILLLKFFHNFENFANF